jgi:hypothetical protein
LRSSAGWSSWPCRTCTRSGVRRTGRISISRGKAGRANSLLLPISSDIAKGFIGQASRPDLAAIVGSGLFDLCIEAIAAFAAAGAEGLRDTHHGVFYSVLTMVRVTRAHPGCEAKIRGAASALAFCLVHNLDYMAEIGHTTGTYAAKVCCSVFGRDEGGSEFSFSTQHVQTL